MSCKIGGAFRFFKELQRRIGIVLEKYKLGPAKTCILRGTPRTYAIKTRAVTDN